MIRMEIALILVLAFVAYIYFSAGRRHTLLHRTFSVLLVTALVHLVFDALTVYTVARLDSVPRPVNDVLHRLFIGSMVLVVYLFYQYIAVLIEEETGKPRRLDLAAKVYLAAAELGAARSDPAFTSAPFRPWASTLSTTIIRTAPPVSRPSPPRRAASLTPRSSHGAPSVPRRR